jgi:hypothetical protein
MFGLFRRKLTIPPGMVQLRALPVDETGVPEWNGEIERATAVFGTDFLRPFMFETSPGQCIGGFVARGSFKISVRKYVARAVLIQRKNDEFRTTMRITASAMPQEETGDRSWGCLRERISSFSSEG